MGLSLKNPVAVELARKVAKETGESVTQAILHALEERLERVIGARRAPSMLDEILTISQRCRKLPDYDPRSPDEILGYNESGGFE